MERVRNTGMNILFIAGLILMFGVIGADDFHTIELGEFQPLNWRLFFEGVLLITPKLLRGFDNENE